MLSRFTTPLKKRTLKELYDFPLGVYPVGRLDEDSEGLLILTDDKHLNHYLLNPTFGHRRTYLVLVQGEANEEHVKQLESGVTIRVKDFDYQTRPCEVEICTPPENLPDRTPPIKLYFTKKYSWLKITLTEGKFRQVRKMTAKVGLPTIRLIRTEIAKIKLNDMQPGEVREMSRHLVYRKLFGNKKKSKTEPEV